MSRVRGGVGRARNWCFTLNNPEEETVDLVAYDGGAAQYFRAGDGERIKALIARVDIVFIVCQEERGESGTRHLQGYIEFDRSTRFNKVKALLGERAHLEMRHGTQDQAIAYCKKADSYVEGGIRFEIGTPKGSGGFKQAVLDIQSGMSVRAVALEHPEVYVRHGRGLRDLAGISKPDRHWAMEIMIFYGPTGAGKSYSAMQLDKNAYTPPWPARNGVWWWDQYDGQETVILDEFRCQVSLTTMLKLLDRYPHQVQVKGGFVKFTSKRIIITTNLAPETWYGKVGDVSPLRRRLTDFAKIYKFSLPLPRDAEGLPVPSKELVALAPRRVSVGVFVPDPDAWMDIGTATPASGGEYGAYGA